MSTTTLDRRGFMAHLCAGAAIPFAYPRVSVAAKAVSLHRLALIGCGSRGAGCLAALASGRTETPRIVAVCDTDASRGHYWARYVNAAYREDWRDCVESSEVEGLIIAAPDAISHSICATAAAHGKSVFWDCSTSTTPYALLREIPGDDAALHLLSPVAALARGAASFMADCGIGAARFGHACRGKCTQTADAHLLQTWFLIEALGAKDSGRARTISDHARQCLMTEVAYERGLRLEITSTTRNAASEGVCIRCDAGTLRAHAQRLTCIPTTGPGKTVIVDDVRRTRLEALGAWLRNDQPIPGLPVMRHVANDVARLTRRWPEAGPIHKVSATTMET